MTCDKLVKEALAGIDFRYKMDDVINELPDNQKFTSVQLEGFLRKKGVSPKEIKANSILTRVPPNKAYTAKEWRRVNEARGKQYITQRDLGQKYKEITLDKGSRGTDYKETGDIIQQQLEDNVPTPHYEDKLKLVENAPFTSEYLLGHRRVHLDTINGKPTTVLNELQSDWAQAQRDGRGVFKSNLTGDEVRPNIIADFPMSPAKYQQYQIVRTIDEAIKNGTNRIAIPIERKGDLAGTKGVTKFYDSLNKRLLPDIRKKLEKQGLRIKLSKEYYNIRGSILEANNKEKFDFLYEEDPEAIYEIIEKLYKSKGFIHRSDDLSDDEVLNIMFDKLDATYSRELSEMLANDIKELVELTGLPESLDNTLHVLEIEEIPNKPVRWDIYSVLGSLGLSEVADKLKEEEN